MAHYPYLIVGGGMAAGAAIRGIREVDPAGAIGVIGSEAHPPYQRPPLSKGLWKGKPLQRIWIDVGKQGVDLMLGRTAQTLDTANKRVVDDQGAVYTFDRLLLATGGVPRHFPWDGDAVIYYRTLDDYQRLRALAERSQRFAVIGGGFIGSEIAAALAMNGKEVVMIFPEAGISQHLFGPELAAFLNTYYRERGVEVLPGETVQGLEQRGETKVLQTTGGREILVDGVVAGIGITPNSALAQAAGLTVDDGVVVDELLRTSHPDIYAAGDVANFPNPALGRRIRVEHEDNANTMGRHAGRTMAGEQVPYKHLPFFYSDLFDLGYEAVGLLDARLEMVADWQEPFRTGVVYYLGDGRVRGVLLWNVWDQVDAARRLIAEPGPFRAADLSGRLPA
ncbi:MAG TPA: FAD/NAD(P)-binding oxidoreductase [Roseiflexaceae bacterium]|nr:FAD/NAD(P)-binding oxidoreductase [Roseiflexaceae bacterium]